MKDIFAGKELMKDVKEKKYLGDIVAKDGTNALNIKDKTNKAMGNVNKIVMALSERAYGKHTFKAAKLMRDAILVSGLLTNAESWINLTMKNLEELEKPDIILSRKIISQSGNPAKCFMQLELGLIPVKYIIMQKRMNFLNYILNKSKESMLRQVFIALKEDSRKGDFKELTDKDRIELEIELEDEEIEVISKVSWKKYVKEKVKYAAFKYLLSENSSKEKTKDIHFKEFKMSVYLERNENTMLSKIIFSVRSKTLDIKEYQPWNYYTDLCVACERSPETMHHFMTCTVYENHPCENWRDINGICEKSQINVGLAVEKRIYERENIIDIKKVGWADSNSSAPGSC